MACLTISASFKRSTLSQKDLPAKKRDIDHNYYLFLFQSVSPVRQTIPVTHHQPLLPQLISPIHILKHQLNWSFYEFRQKHNERMTPRWNVIIIRLEVNGILKKRIGIKKEADKQLLTIPAQALQAVSQQLAVSVDSPGFVHQLVQLLVLVLSCKTRKHPQTEQEYVLAEVTPTVL